MESAKKFKEDHILAFIEAGLSANSQNVTSESSVEDTYVEISRTLFYPKKPKRVLEAALSAWGVDDDNDEGLTCSVVEVDTGCKVYLMWRMYLGIEVRDNSVADFKSWAKHKSELFDQAEQDIRVFNPKSMATGKVSLRVMKHYGEDSDEILRRLLSVCEGLEIQVGDTINDRKMVRINLDDGLTHSLSTKLLDRAEKVMLSFSPPSIQVSIEIA